MASKSTAKNDAQPGSILLVIHNFVARSADELSLAKGDRIELIERDDDFGDGWFLGRHMTNGNTGLFPEVYTTTAPRGALHNATSNRRASDGPQKLSQGGSSMPAQQRHLSASAVTVARPSSATSAQQSSASPPTLRTTALSSANKGNAVHTDSPVMNETLSVIDEHMNDMHAPQPPFANGNQRDTIASSTGSVYSAQPLNRFSYIAGHETDEEEHHLHTEAEVMAWSSERVAEYLDDHGVEKMHCEVFKEQEITGEVLLAMDQSSLFIKEFELGPVGRRLKTWHKIKSLQDEVKQAAAAMTEMPADTPPYSTARDDINESNRNRSSTVGTALPRALSTASRSSEGPNSSSTAEPSGGPVANRHSGMPPLQSMAATLRSENSYRPSAQTIRSMQSSRRHSSIDSTANSIDSTSRVSHRKQASMDQRWQSMQGMRTGGRANHSHAASTDAVLHTRESTGALSSSVLNEMDHEYSSSVERGGTSHVRSASANRAPSTMTVDTNEQSSTVSGEAASPRGWRGASSTGASPIATEGGWTGAASRLWNLRSATSPTLQAPSTAGTSDGSSPLVTRLDYEGNAISTSGNEELKGPSPTAHKFPFFSSQRSKTTGLRAISDAVTKEEKLTASPDKELKADSPALLDRATPSTDTTSIDLQKSEVQSRTSQGSASNLISATSFQRRPRARTKTKKLTSAYTRGLEKKSPVEQMNGCDYSGWMKKKSGSLMTTWKTRLFVLRGRRLSYYYAEDDTEEKGLIDISFHRVLPAQNEMLTGLHASLTGALGSPTSPKETLTETNAQHDLKQPPKPGDVDDDGLFIFKLVPPKTGLSKGVSFTKPTVHYFAVNSRREGRLWMAALMKATIDRDEDGVVTTTYNQKTISLSKARARKERPPALKDTDDDSEDDGGHDSVHRESDQHDEPKPPAPATNEEHGLGIGLPSNIEKDASNPALIAATTAAASITHTDRDDGESLSIAPSSLAPDGAADAQADEDRRVWLEQDREYLSGGPES